MIVYFYVLLKNWERSGRVWICVVIVGLVGDVI